MKRFMTIMAAAALMLAAIACEDKLAPEEVTPAGGSAKFTATTEEAQTKTALSQNGASYEVVWQSGDEITIVDGATTPNVGVYTTTGTGTKADFTFKTGSEAVTPNYTAYYPATLYNNGVPTLPAEQTYVVGNITGAPMYAESATQSLAFKNICGIIRLNVTTTASGLKVRKIVLSANQPMSGPITIGSDFKATITSGTDGVTLDCGTSGAAIGTTATNFLIAVPAGSYEHLKITVVATDGSVQTRTTKSGTSITVERNKITDITLTFSNLTATKGSADIIGDIPQGWVQLWPGGPKWAEFNVGSTISTYAGVTSYTHPDVVGGYYAFKGRYDSKIGSSGGVEDSYGTDDTAAYLWGVNWRTPTYDEELALINNCTWTYCDGITVKFAEGCTLAGWKVSGKDDGYTENAIFLPLAGDIEYNASVPSGMGSSGGYYSSYYVETNGYFLNLNSSGQAIASHFPNIGDCVRAVCVDNVDYNYEDLSASGTANCYIVPAAGYYKFNATVKGNGAANLAGIEKSISKSSEYKASLYWATYGYYYSPKPSERGFIKDVYYDSKSGYIRFSTGDSYDTYPEGNAVIVLKDGSGTILWSWHLWFETDNLESMKQTYPGGAVFMDRNLGATANVNTDNSNSFDYGLIYQWGRKDPFLWNATRTSENSEVTVYGQADALMNDQMSSVAESIQKPHVYAMRGPSAWVAESQTDKDDLWAAQKTIFDPCPPGWKVPGKAAWNDTFVNSLKGMDYSAGYYGYSVPVSSTTAWIPTASFRPGRSIEYIYNRTTTIFEAYKLYSGSGNFYLWAVDGALWKARYYYASSQHEYSGVHNLDEDMNINAPYPSAEHTYGIQVLRSSLYPVRCVKE